MNVRTIDLGQTNNLQQLIESYWSNGVKTFILNGTYKVCKDTYTHLKIGKHLSGITMKGLKAILDGNRTTSHIIIVEDANATIEDITVTSGNTTNPLKVADSYQGSHFRSVYEVVDGAGILILGNSKVKLKRCNILNNHSGMCGGGMSNQGTGSVYVDSCKFENNTSYHTGAAIDNLTNGAQVIVRRSLFSNNLSNTGSICGGPHGQITIFSGTKSNIYHNKFYGTTFPIDASNDSHIISFDNMYQNKQVNPIKPAGAGTLTNKLYHLGHLLTFIILLIRYNTYPWVRH